MAEPSERPTVLRSLVQLAWPVVGLNLLQVLALAVDTAMLGRLPEARAALTGLGYATQLVFLLMVAMMGLTVGTVALVARAHGAGQRERVSHLLQQSTQFTLVLSLGVAVLGNLLATPLLEVLGARGDDLQAALDYLRPLLAFVVFNYLTVLYAAVLRGVGNTRLPLLVALVSNLANIVLNYGLIFGHGGFPALGITGAALGTVTSQLLASGVLTALLRFGHVPGLELSLRPRPWDGPLARRLAQVGLPAALDMLVLNAGFLTIVGLLARLDPAAVAAHGIGLRVQSLAFVPGLSISQATAALVGNRLGSGRVDEARAVVRASVGLCVTVMGLLAAVLWWRAPEVVALFDIQPDTDLGRPTITWIRLLGASQPVIAVYIALVGMYRGAGATWRALAVNLAGTLGVQVPLSWLLGFPLGLGPLGVWLGFPLGFLLKALIATRDYRQGAWARPGATV